MQSSGTGLHRARIRSQSGSVAMLGALWLMIAVICLATIDIGNVFWQKRELQKIADLAALAGAQAETSGDCQNNAKQIATLNGMQGIPVVECGNWAPVPGAMDSNTFFVSGATPINASRVKVSRDIPYFFMFSADAGAGRKVEAVATAARKSNLARVFVRTTLVNISSTREANLLSLLLGGLLGSTLDVNLVGWQGIAKLNLNLLDFIGDIFPALKKIDVSLTVGDYDKLLATEVGVGEVLSAVVKAAERKYSTADVGVKALGIIAAAAKISPLTLKLGDLLNLKTANESDALNLSANVLELVQAFIQVGNGNNALLGSVEIPLVKVGGIYQGAKVDIGVIEKPQWMIGDPDKQDIVAKTAQIRLGVGVNLLGIVVGLGLEVGGASATLPRGRYSCVSGDKKMEIVPSASILKITKLQINILTEQIGPIKVDVIGKYSSGAVLIANNGTPSVVKNAPSNQPSNIDKPLVDEDWRNFEGDLNIVKTISSTVKNLIKDIIDSDAQGFITFVLKLLLGLTSPLLDVVTWLMSNILSPILDPILNELLKLIGVDISNTQVAGQLTCGTEPFLVY